jgi:hypothetical protein
VSAWPSSLAGALELRSTGRAHKSLVTGPGTEPKSGAPTNQLSAMPSSPFTKDPAACCATASAVATILRLVSVTTV